MESMRVEERPMSLLEKREFIRAFNKAHPKLPEPMPSGWWIAPGLIAAMVALIAVLA